MVDLFQEILVECRWTFINVEGAGNRTQVAQGVTPEKKGSVITVPIPAGGGSAPTPPQRSKGGADLSIPSRNYVK